MHRWHAVCPLRSDLHVVGSSSGWMGTVVLGMGVLSRLVLGASLCEARTPEGAQECQCWRWDETGAHRTSMLGLPVSGFSTRRG